MLKTKHIPLMQMSLKLTEETHYIKALQYINYYDFLHWAHTSCLSIGCHPTAHNLLENFSS